MMRRPSRAGIAAATSVAVFGFALTYCVAVALMERNMVFDDAYITYRYASNMVHGYGLVWNPGELPFEGYTNFLLVIVLAPFIGLGVDPQLTARLFGLAAIVLTAGILYAGSRRHHDTCRSEGLLVVTAFLLLTKSVQVAMLGLETLPYSAMVLVALLLAGRCLENDSHKDAVLFGLTSFLALALRPEAVILVVTFALAWSARCARQGFRSCSPRVIGAAALAFGLPLAAYLTFKSLYFGDVLPSAYYLKAAYEIS
jgi:arabinofuranosyltransferase